MLKAILDSMDSSSQQEQASDECQSHCYTMSEVPGKRIMKALGLVHFCRKGIGGDILKRVPLLFQGLYSAARSAGGNAVINVRVEASSYEAQGSQWHSSFIIAYGDAVILEDLHQPARGPVPT